jgi:hypothetical protein
MAGGATADLFRIANATELLRCGDSLKSRDSHLGDSV